MQPIDIQKTRFAQKLRGYDPTEVENFLSLVAEELTQRLAQIERLERETRSLQARVDVAEERERQLHDTISMPWALPNSRIADAGSDAFTSGSSGEAMTITATPDSPTKVQIEALPSGEACCCGFGDSSGGTSSLKKPRAVYRRPPTLARRGGDIAASAPE